MERQPEIICEPGANKKRNLLYCSFNIGRQAGRHVSEPTRMILKGTYLSERSRLHKILDFSGALVLALVIGLVTYLVWPRQATELIHVSATVAPTEVTTGGNSTLTFRYENQSDETLRNVRLNFELPAHFMVASVDGETLTAIGAQEFSLTEVPAGGYGYVHLRGTMFGDVGGEQLFKTTFTYTYGENNSTDSKTTEHYFQPEKSTLTLDLKLPEHLIAFQSVDGEITYTNNGDVTFPDLIIEPTWPANFVLKNSTPALSGGVFRVKGVEPGETGIITFSGRLGNIEDTTFNFYPSFSFSDESYRQEQLTATIDILPSPLAITQTIDEATLTPGDTVSVVVDLKNVSEGAITNIKPELIFDSSYFGAAKTVSWPERLEPGESASTTILLPVRAAITRNASNTQNITASVQTSVTFDLQIDGQTVTTNTVGSASTSKLTSPVSLQAFGRFYSPSGDQLGRGPLPPLVGETTKYWIFWNIAGTTNDLTGVHLEADLAPGVTMTGRQSVSVGQPITQNGDTVSWSLSSMSPTLPGGSTVIGVAFEVAITPTEAMAGTVPTLLNTSYLTATDTFTGATVAGSARAVTTYLIADPLAAPYAEIKN